MVNITDYFIRRPVAASALSLFILLIGLFALGKLPLRLYPKVEEPLITITTTYGGASAEVMKNFVTTTLQNAIVGVDGVNYITANSTQGTSTISVYLQLGTNIDTALSAIQSKIDSVRGNLPAEVDNPSISKANADDRPSLVIAVTSQQWSSGKLGDYLIRVLKPQLETIDGVSKAQVWGDTYAMRIWLNPDSMTAMQVTANDVADAVKQQNTQAAAGNTQGKYVNYDIQANTDLTTADEFNNIAVKQVGDATIHIKDIGQAELGSQSDTISAFVKGKPAAMMGVYLMPDANPLRTLQQVRQLMPKLQKQLPADLHAEVVYDTSVPIEDSLHEVIKSLSYSVLIVIAVIFVFMRQWRVVLIPVIAMPLSLIGVAFVMHLAGCSLNSLTLLAMVLAIGLVVDDAIVVMENISRHIEAGQPPFQAALSGAREIAPPVIAMTITLAAVYAPICFMGGLTGFLFSEFAYTLAGTVIISGIIALTLSPMMCARILKNAHPEGNSHEGLFTRISHHYERLLGQVLQRKKIVLSIWALAFVACFYLYHSIASELAPQDDPGFLQVISNAPTYTNSEFLRQYTQRLTPIYQSFNNVTNSIYINGIPSESQAISFLLLKPWAERSEKIAMTQLALQQKLAAIPGLQNMVLVPSNLPATSSMPLGFVIKSLGSYRDLYQASQQLQQAAQGSGLFLFVDSDLHYEKPQLNMHIDRQRAADLGIKVSDLADSLSYLFSGNRLQQFSWQGQTYDVILQAPENYRTDADILNKVNVRNQRGDLLPLSSVLQLSNSIEPSGLNQFQKFNSVTLSGMLMPGHTLSEALHFLQTTAQRVLPPGFSTDYAGESRQFLAEQFRMLWAFALAIVVIFLVLAMQFESYRDPLIILLGSVPMAFFAGLLLLKCGLGTLNIYTQIGLLTLIGLISKHGILMTRFANELCHQQLLTKQQAICKAAVLRLRPILMTTLAMVFGAVPLLLAQGAGANSRFALGIVITSGLSIGTVFTLFVVPVIYIVFAKIKMPDDPSKDVVRAEKTETMTARLD